jgi:OOP family OmpA-OmpF porin
MTHRTKLTTRCAIVAAAFIAAGAQAQSPAQPVVAGKMSNGLYLGASVGQARADINVAPPAGVPFDSFTKDDTNFAWKLVAGFPFYPGLAFELGYTRLGRVGFKADVPGGSVTQTSRIMGYTAEVVATLPVWRQLSILGRIGGYYNDTTPGSSSTGPITVNSVAASDREWNIKTGLGLQYDISRAFSVRAEAERYRKLGPYNLNLELYSVGMVYRLE